MQQSACSILLQPPEVTSILAGDVRCRSIVLGRDSAICGHSHSESDPKRTTAPRHRAR
jgi:hypothetical protein